MIKVGFASSFVRKIKRVEKVNKALFEEAFEKIELFKFRVNHRSLKVHKLHGDLKKYFAFSVNHAIRIIFEYIEEDHVILHELDDHSIYKR